ncbi:MAG TPA: efflux RND transporter periplasmic adaptor subunit [Polyangiaceae bacterium]|nr:efflux RND transporter periplasmic adaptor subunit [Polyangiaceae bacterium]
MISVARRRRVSVLYVLAPVVALLVYWRSKPVESAMVKKPKRDVPYLDGKWIRYSADYARRSQVEFRRVGAGDLAPDVDVTGTVAFDPARMAAIGARVAGRVRRIYKLEGDAVQAGDVLAEIESVELGKAEAALTVARAQATAATANERREVALAEAHISSRREAELAIDRATAARAELVAAQQRVQSLCVTACGGAGILKLASPISGKVVERNVSRGQSVDATKTAFVVADLSRLWVNLAVFERQLTAIREGDLVDLYPQSDPKQIVKGSVGYVGDVIDLQTRTASVRVVVDNPEVRLRPGESALAKVHPSARVAASVVVPRGAVTSVDGKPTVFVAKDALSVEPREIRLGARDGSQIEVVAGLREGDSVATSGVFALKSEIFR